MAEYLQGYAAAQRRLTAISTVKLGPTLMRKLALQATADAKLLVPRKTGNLGRSIHVGVVTSTAAQVVASANYAAYVEHGTGPHEITPNAKKALRWVAAGYSKRLSGTATKATQAAGGFAFAKVVHHPGTKAHPYMMPGAVSAVAKAGLAEVVVTAWNDAA